MNKGVSVCLVAWMMVVASVASRGQSSAQSPGQSSAQRLSARHADQSGTASPATTSARRRAGSRSTRCRLSNIPAGAETWEKVIRKVRGGQMPPSGMPRPTQAALDGLVTHLEILDRQGGARRADAASPRDSSPEPLRVRKRHPRSLRARRRRLRAPASRRGSLRLRQQRDGAEHLDVAHGAIPLGRLEDQQPRRRQPEDHAVARDVPRARRSLAARPRAGPADRHARRHRDPPLLPGRRRVRDQPAALSGDGQHRPRSRARARPRSHPRRPAHRPGAVRRPEGRTGELPAADAGRRRDGEALPEAPEGLGGHRTRSVWRFSRRARRRRSSCCSRSSGSASIRSRRSESPSSTRSRSRVRSTRPGRTSAPSRQKVFTCTPRDPPAGRGRVREDDPLVARTARVPRPGERHRHDAAPRLLHEGARQRR